jgi:hypothetical protein
MAPDPDSVLLDGLMATLSELCFATPEGLCFDGTRVGEIAWLVEVAAEGRMAALWLAASAPALERLAANMLGLDGLATEAHCADALREIANVLAGHVVRALSGEAALDHVSLPVSVPSDRLRALLPLASAQTCVDVEGGLLLAAVQLRQGEPSAVA